MSIEAQSGSTRVSTPTTSIAWPRERSTEEREQLVQLVVAGPDDRRGQQLVGTPASLEPSADVHRDVGDLVVEQRDAQALLQAARDEHRDLEDHGVRRLERFRQRIARPGLLTGAVLEVLHVQRQPQDEVLGRDVDEEFGGRRLDDFAHRRLDFRIQPRAGIVRRRGCAGGDDPREDQGREVLQVAGAERDPEVALDEALQDRGHLLLGGQDLTRRTLQAAMAGDAVRGDRDVHHDIRDSELVDEVAERAEFGDELGLEGAERVRADRSLAQRAAQRLEVEGSGIHLVVRELAQQAPLRHLGPAQARLRCGALQREFGAAEQPAHAREVGVERRGADVQVIGGLEHVDAVVGVQQGAHERMQAVAGGSGIRPRSDAQRRSRLRPGAVSLGSRLHRDAVGDARIDRGHIRADAARGHSDAVGERGCRDPFPVAREQTQEALLSRSGHVVLCASVRSFESQSITHRRAVAAGDSRAVP